jgi:DNA-binding NtrC family response regulator
MESAPLKLPEGVTLEQMMQGLERQLIESTLRRCDNHKERAAKELGLARSSLRQSHWRLRICSQRPGWTRRENACRVGGARKEDTA